MVPVHRYDGLCMHAFLSSSAAECPHRTALLADVRQPMGQNGSERRFDAHLLEQFQWCCPRGCWHHGSGTRVLQ